jgi:hypothetical protein
MLFVVALVVGMALSFGFVSLNSAMLHGDGALAIIAAPITGAIVSVPIAILFAVILGIMSRNRRSPDPD